MPLTTAASTGRFRLRDGKFREAMAAPRRAGRRRAMGHGQLRALAPAHKPGARLAARPEMSSG